MPIPEYQLETWSSQGTIERSASTYRSIQTAISSIDAIKSKRVEVHLQGSYRNSTNTYGNSDVDVVVMLADTHYDDAMSLGQYEQLLFTLNRTPATYTFWDFRTDVALGLHRYYGAGMVTSGKKCLKVTGNASRLDADVVVCCRHNRYIRYPDPLNAIAEQGIVLFTQESQPREIVNYPKQHYKNGAAKNQHTNGHYKETVRIIKNMRQYLVDKGQLSKSDAPSYFLECLLYNVPNYCFDQPGLHGPRVYSVLQWLDTQQNIAHFTCQNGLVLLFGNRPEDWNLVDAHHTIRQLGGLWYRWPL